MDTLHYKFTKPSKLVASFDLDGTLIRTKSGKKFAKDKDDYKYSFDNVIEKLHNLMENGYKIVIFTNQKGISMNKVSKTDIINKIEKLFPFADYFIACNDDIYRKPMIGMYEKFIKLNCEYEDMFYVGDAAGRKGDFPAVGNTCESNTVRGHVVARVGQVDFVGGLFTNHRIQGGSVVTLSVQHRRDIDGQGLGNGCRQDV